MPRKIPVQFRDLVFLVFMTVLMGVTISGIMTVWHGSGGSSFAVAWLWSFARTYVIVLPTVLIVGPIARRLTAAVTAAPTEPSVDHEAGKSSGPAQEPCAPAQSGGRA